jgi:hypothetical protein
MVKILVPLKRWVTSSELAALQQLSKIVEDFGLVSLRLFDRAATARSKCVRSESQIAAA